MARAEGRGAIASSLPACSVLCTKLGTQCLAIGRLTCSCACLGVPISPLFQSSCRSITGTPRTRASARHTPRRRFCDRREGSSPPKHDGERRKPGCGAYPHGRCRFFPQAGKSVLLALSSDVKTNPFAEFLGRVPPRPVFGGQVALIRPTIQYRAWTGLLIQVKWGACSIQL